MAVRRNSYYNDPAIGEAFSSLAEVFAPPKATDVYAYTKAASERAEAARLAEFFNLAKDPAVDPTRFDRIGIATGRFNPTQSYYAVDQNNATTLGKTRIEADAAREREVLSQRGALTREMLNPVGAGATRFVPPDLATMFGVDPTQTGVVDVAPGHIAHVPGRAAPIVGAAKPMTVEELKAQILAKQPENMQTAAAMGSTPVENVVTPAGPRVAWRTEAVGQEPVIKDTAERMPVNYTVPGTGVSGRTADGKTDIKSGAPLPREALLSSPVAGAGATAGFSTTSNKTSAVKLKATIASSRLLADAVDQLADAEPGAFGAPGTFLGGAQNLQAMLGEVGSFLGNKAPDAKVSIDEIRAGLNSATGGVYNPAFQKAKMLVGEMAYQYAQVNNPSGEVSRQAFERALETIQSGWFANNQSAKAGAAAFRDLLKRKEVEADVLMGAGGAAPTGTSPAAAEAAASTGGVTTPVKRFERGPDGAMRRVQ